MTARDKIIFSVLQTELNPNDSDHDDDESAASSEDEYVPSDESDSEEEYIEKNLHYIKEEFEPEDEKLQNEEKCQGAIHQDKYTARDGTIWEIAVPQRHRTQQHNIVHCRARPKNIPRILTEVVQAFRLYLSNQILKKTILHTNVEATRVYPEKQSQTTWKLTDKTEILAYVGLIMAAGQLTKPFIY